MSESNRRPIGLAIILLLLLPLPWMLNDYLLGVMMLGATYAIAIIGLHFLMGLAGQLSLAQGAFFGIGAYTSAILAVDHGWSFLPTLLAAVVVALLLGVVIGYACLRLTGHYLALATIGLAVITTLVMHHWYDVTHGPDGIPGIPAPVMFGYVLDQKFYYFYLVWVFLAVLAFIGWRVKNSRVGRAFEAIREDELAAATSGVNVLAFKVLAFTMSTVFGALAGALYSHGDPRYVAPDTFNFDLSVLFLVMLLLGGQRSVPGAIIGALLVTALPDVLRFLGDWYLVVYAVFVVLLVIYLPQGLWGLFEEWAAKRRRGSANRSATDPEVAGA